MRPGTMDRMVFAVAKAGRGSKNDQVLLALSKVHTRTRLSPWVNDPKACSGTVEGWGAGSGSFTAAPSITSKLLTAVIPPAVAVIVTSPSATGRAAQCLGLEGSIGTVERGKLADLVLVDADPLGDPSSLELGQSVRLVMKEGEVAVDRL